MPMIHTQPLSMQRVEHDLDAVHIFLWNSYEPAVKVAGANLRRGVVIKNEDSCAFCIRLLLTFLH